MVLHNSLFRSGTIYDVPDIIGLIERRIEWMDCNGINQWNKAIIVNVILTVIIFRLLKKDCCMY